MCVSVSYWYVYIICVLFLLLMMTQQESLRIYNGNVIIALKTENQTNCLKWGVSPVFFARRIVYNGSCRIYVICDCLCIVVATHIVLCFCFVFLRLLTSFSGLCIFDCPFGIL